MASENIVKSVGTRGGISFFKGEYVPSNDAEYNVVKNGYFTLPYNIDDISILNNIIVIGVSQIQSVFVYQVIENVFSLLKIITPQTSNIKNTVSFGKSVKITDTGIFVGDPDTNTSGQVFVFYQTQNGSNLWFSDPSVINPVFGITDSIGFGTKIDATNDTIYISAPNYKNQSTIGACFFYKIDYISKNINYINYNINPDNVSDFASNIKIINQTQSIVSSINSSVTSGSTYTNAGCLYFYDTTSVNPYNSIQNPYPSNNSNFGYSFYVSGNYLLISEINNGDEGKIILYKNSENNWNYINYFNIETLSIDILADGSIEGEKVFMIDSVMLWTANNSVYVSEITEAGNIVPSHTPVLSNTDYSNYGSTITPIDDIGFIVTGYDGQKTIFDMYTLIST